jgi:CAAX amino terminal protease family.
VLTGEGWSGLRLWPNIRDHWWAYVAAWLGTSILVGAGFGIYVALKLVGLVSAPASTQAQLSLVELALTLTLSPLINTFVAVGEEFGWRAYLLRKLEPMGIGRALVIHGLIWGVWHWPLITLGYNYGFNYPAAPWGGLVVMSIATVAIGTVIGTAALLADSVWPAALAHGTLNAVGSIGVLVSGIGIVAATPVALVGVIPWAIVAVVLLSRADRISDEPAGTCGTLDHAVVGES